MKALIALLLSICLYFFIVGWVTVFPTLGLLWLFGALT